jgi:Tol biopolymer transport system component
MMSLSPDQTSLLYADQWTNGSIHRLDLVQNHDTLLLEDSCLLVDQVPSWSPEGTRVAFAKGCPDTAHSTQIHLMNVNGCCLQPLRAPAVGEVDRDPTWAPNGRRIAVGRGSGNVPWRSEIDILDLVTGLRRRLTSGAMPAWSPTGEWIAFVRWDSTSMKMPSVWLARPDGTQERQVVATEPREQPPNAGEVWWGPVVWSADGSALAIARLSSVWTVGTNGGSPRAFVRRR